MFLPAIFFDALIQLFLFGLCIDNDDDNLIMGLCIDNVSVCGSVKVQLGVEEVRELSPCCVLICLTLEGKLIMFQIAR